MSTPTLLPTLSMPPARGVEPSADQQKGAQREAKEALWRATLDSMTREELIDLVIAGGWEAKRLWKHLNSLRDKYLAQRNPRRKGGRLKHAETNLVKDSARQLWESDHWRTRRTKHGQIKQFAETVVDAHPHVQLEISTVTNWTREWRTQNDRTRAISTVENCPEIYMLLAYGPLQKE